LSHKGILKNRKELLNKQPSLNNLVQFFNLLLSEKSTVSRI